MRSNIALSESTPNALNKQNNGIPYKLLNCFTLHLITGTPCFIRNSTVNLFGLDQASLNDLISATQGRLTSLILNTRTTLHAIRS